MIDALKGVEDDTPFEIIANENEEIIISSTDQKSGLV
jgi:hypothetical protein